MIEKNTSLTRQKKKALLGRLKKEVASKMPLIYLAAFLSWLQFLTRIISFYLIAQMAYRIYQGYPINLGNLLLALLGLNGLGFGLAYFAKKLQGIASQFARDNLKKAFFEAFIKQDGHFEQDVSLADTFMVASQGIDSLDTYYSHYLSLSFRTLFNCSSVLALVLAVFPKGALVFLLTLPLIPLSIILMQNRSKKIMAHYWGTYMDVGNLFLDHLKGLNTLYSYQVDQAYEDNFLKKAESFRVATMNLLAFQLQAVGYMDVVMYLGVGISGLLSVNAMALGQLNLASFLFFILIATEFFVPIREQGYGMHLVMMNTKMADRIFSFLDSITTDNELLAYQSETMPAFDQVSVRNLSFSYDQKPLLSNITIDLQKGQLTALAGVSGRGKTSLAQLFLKRFLADSGNIFFGKQSIRDLSQKAINTEVMYISNQSYLLNQSIYDNLAMATDMSKEDLQIWLKKTDCLNFIDKLPDGLDTLVGSDGDYLSPGQRQQVICTRAILAKRSFYIFDEITASVDQDNEKVIMELIKHLASEAIVLMITHKMKQVALADQVLFLEAKQIARVADPVSLYQQNKIYRNLVDTQTGLEESQYA
ncbi:ABC transporter ATP-binding protein/permease [Streptococcus hongkongensis]|nr:ABC transporter ATP-binding protein [Streptococcus uberis]